MSIPETLQKWRYNLFEQFTLVLIIFFSASTYVITPPTRPRLLLFYAFPPSYIFTAVNEIISTSKTPEWLFNLALPLLPHQNKHWRINISFQLLKLFPIHNWNQNKSWWKHTSKLEQSHFQMKWILNDTFKHIKD